MKKKMNKNTFQAQTVMFHHKISDTTSQQFGKESTKSGTSIKPFLRRYKNGWFLVEMVTSGLLQTNKPTDLIIWDMASILGGFCQKGLRFDFAYKQRVCTINEVTWPEFRACAMLKYGNFQKKIRIKIVFQLKLWWFITKSVTQHPYNISHQFGKE